MHTKKGSKCLRTPRHFLGEQSAEYLQDRSRQDECTSILSGNRTRWQRLKATLFPYLKRSRELAYAYTEAKVEKERGEARKVTGEADEIAARKDLTRQKEVKEFNRSVDDIFKNDGLASGAKVLKLAKLIEKNPQVVEQLEIAEEVIGMLALKKSINIEVVEESKKVLLGEAEEKG